MVWSIFCFKYIQPYGYNFNLLVAKKIIMWILPFVWCMQNLGIYQGEKSLLLNKVYRIFQHEKNVFQKHESSTDAVL